MLIKLKFGKAIGTTTRKAHQILAAVLRNYNHARTYIETQWYLQQDDGAKFKWLPSYKIATSASPCLGTHIASAAFQEIRSRLTAKAPYTMGGKYKYEWQAIMGMDAQLAVSRARSFPLAKQRFSLGYAGLAAGDAWVKQTSAMSEQRGQGILQASLLSKHSGCANKHLTFEVLTRKLTPGQKEILNNMVNPDHPFAVCDSRVVLKDGAWYLHLVYKDESMVKSEFDDDRHATLYPGMPEAKHGFKIVGPDGYEWGLGPNEWYANRMLHLASNRRELQNRPNTGHGRVRHIRDIKGVTRGKNKLEDRCRLQWISDICKWMQKREYTSLLYREPTLGAGVRSHDWFAAHQLNQNWTKFEADLRGKLNDSGIAYKKHRINLTEFATKETDA